MDTSETIGESAVDSMKISGFLFFIVAVLRVVLEVISDVLDISILSVISIILLGAAVIFLAISMRRISQISTSVVRAADITAGWLIGYVVFDIIAVIIIIYRIIMYLPLILYFLALIARVIGFNNLNRVFGKLSKNDNRMDSVIFPLYGWYGLFPLIYMIIQIILDLLLPLDDTLKQTIVLVIWIILLIGEILLLFVIGYKLVRNSSSLRLSIETSQISAQAQTSDQKRDFVKTYAIEESLRSKFCSNCGSSISATKESCENCGVEV